ncbi:hypothetical protein CTheo_3754 [Ceratobasidium theobromae]|uniref:Uncharacterized protein n=1 Tax=Ceratobasidium theobromae TaxID=1582974 RepID=A0A5N5QLY1_9AGAM|nr:hypothetical protein CTheo_3754 [Ceratobasidium theobromae]
MPMHKRMIVLLEIPPWLTQTRGSDRTQAALPSGGNDPTTQTILPPQTHINRGGEWVEPRLDTSGPFASLLCCNPISHITVAATAATTTITTITTITTTTINMRSKIIISAPITPVGTADPAIPIKVATPAHTLPPYSAHRPSRYTLNNPKPSLYSSVQLARCLLAVFHREDVTEDQILLVEHIIRSVSKFEYRREPKVTRALTELSWSALERMSIDLVVLAGGCGVSLRNEDWSGPKIDLRELYHRVVEKVAQDLLKSKNLEESIIRNLQGTLNAAVQYLRGVDRDILRMDLGWFVGQEAKCERIVNLEVEMKVEVRLVEKAVEAREEIVQVEMVGGAGKEA